MGTNGECSNIQILFFCFDRYPTETCEPRSMEKSRMLNQGTMHFQKHNPVLLKYLHLMNDTYRQGLKFLALGPPLVHEAASIVLGYKNQPSTPKKSKQRAQKF